MVDMMMMPQKIKQSPKLGANGNTASFTTDSMNSATTSGTYTNLSLPLTNWKPNQVFEGQSTSHQSYGQSENMPEMEKILLDD